MSPEELKALLDIKPKEASKTSIPTAKEPKQLSLRSSPTFFRLDKFDMEQGERLSKMKICEEHKLASPEMADLHGACFLPEPEQTKSCTDKRREEFLANLVETPEYENLHNSTALNLAASDLAAIEFGKRYSKLKKDDEERQNKSGKKDPAKEEAKAEARCVKAASEALTSAKEEVENYLDCCRGIGTGGEGETILDAQRTLDAYARIKNSPQLRRIFEMAGRFRRFAQAKQRQKVSHGYDDVVGVEIGGEIAKLVPSELLLLSDPDTELDAMRRIVENQAVIRKHKGTEKVGKGPIVVCVDESVSMDGYPIAQAKAFALAMAWIAKHQKRWIALVGYSGATQGNLLCMPPNKWDETKLLNWLCHFFGGGTDMDIPLRELPTKFWQQINPPKGKVDLIIISDALVWIPPNIRDPFLEWKKREQVKVFSLILNNPPGDLASVSDETYTCRSINLNETAIERCFSI